MLKALQDFMAGETPIGTGVNAVPREVCSYQAIIPKHTDWRNHVAQPV
jgi:phthalate 4,5-dioxygenase oxygenase subunit